jgi:hypothetical protein
MDSEQLTTSDLLTQLVAEETNRRPTAREKKRWPNHNGLPPHLRSGPRHSLYPTLTTTEILSTRAVIAWLLSREYGLSVEETAQVLRCEDDRTIEKLIAVGDEIAPGSAVTERMKQAVLRAAQTVVAANEPEEQRSRIHALAQGKTPRPKPAAPPRGPLGSAHTGRVRTIIVYLLRKEFEFTLVNLGAIFGYLTRENIRHLEAKGCHQIERFHPGYHAGKPIFRAAEAIVGKQQETEEKESRQDSNSRSIS